MADQNTPNRSSNMEKAEGDRKETGITNRPLDEEIENQKEVPARGDAKPGAHAG